MGIGFIAMLLVGYSIGTEVSRGLDFSSSQKEVIDNYRNTTQSSRIELSLLTRRIAILDARLSRLDVLGGQLTDQYDLSSSEFNFSDNPGVGGVSKPIDYVDNARRLVFNLDRLESDLDETEMQIKILTDLIGVRDLKKQLFPAAWPVDKGWVSSHFGYRISPFSGRRESHRGLDISGHTGNRIYAVASGIIKRSVKLPRYGNLVEIEHGNKYITRYAHNQVNLVQVGDVVKQGDVIALMGTTGRSTGPHLHFEVIKNGRRINPVNYLSRR